ncbi:MAG TPA: hypothetical protein VI636_02150 [Candidatus Angelobacter sp.]
MRITRLVILTVVMVLLLGCGKSRQLASLLPDAPDGWSAEGSATNNDVSGVGHSSTRSYTPTGANSGLGIERVKVQILLGEKGADQQKLQEMSIESKGQFKEKKEVSGFPAYESLPLPSNDTHSLDILPKSGTFVQIIAYKGGAGWDKTENRAAAVSAFAGKIDFKKVAAQE